MCKGTWRIRLSPSHHSTVRPVDLASTHMSVMEAVSVMSGRTSRRIASPCSPVHAWAQYSEILLPEDSLAGQHLLGLQACRGAGAPVGSVWTASLRR